MTTIEAAIEVSMVEWFRVQQLYTDYAELLDEQRLGPWVELFDTDCLYRAISRENEEAGLPLSLMRCEGVAGLRDRVNAIENVSVYAPRTMRHLISGIRVEPGDEPDKRRVRASFAVMQTLQGDHTQVYASGVYRDEIRVTGDRLVFTAKTAVYDNSLIVNSMVYPL
jgi:anthranilate 1,2-dioxygenase small subunit